MIVGPSHCLQAVRNQSEPICNDCEPTGRFVTIHVEADVVKTFLLELTRVLDLRPYGEPIVFSPASGMGRDENAGYDAFVPLIDSGISAYIWTERKFFSIVLYTCKGFEQDTAIQFIERFFETKRHTVHLSF
jgi:S-adenosylmethionine/arginine decarboxylase-like enzyme